MIDTVRNKVELIQGTKLNDNSYISFLPIIPVEKQMISSYVQFITLCTSRENTSYEYSISIDDKNAWFDAYFVSSKE